MSRRNRYLAVGSRGVAPRFAALALLLRDPETIVVAPEDNV